MSRMALNGRLISTTFGAEHVPFGNADLNGSMDVGAEKYLKQLRVQTPSHDTGV